MNPRMFLGLVLLVLVSAPAVAVAQEPPDLDRAKESFKAGATAYAAGEYLAAIQALDTAYGLTPLPAIAFSLAQAERRQYFVAHQREHLDRAITLFRRYIDQVPQGGRRADALDALSQLEPLAATLIEKQEKESAAHSPEGGGAVRPTRLMITAEAPGARLSLDGGPPVPSPLIREVEPGKHRVSTSAGGFYPDERDLTAVAGELIPVSVSLRERPATLTVTAPGDAELFVDGAFVSRGGDGVALQLPSGTHRLSVAEKGHRVSFHLLDLGPGETAHVPVVLEPTWQRRTSRALFIGGGVALGVGIVASVLAVGAEDRAQEFLRKQSEGNVTTSDLSSYRSAVTDRNRYRTLTTVSVATSLGLLITGLILYEMDHPEPQEIDRAAPKVDVDRPRTADRATHPRTFVAPVLAADGVVQSCARPSDRKPLRRVRQILFAAAPERALRARPSIGRPGFAGPAPLRNRGWPAEGAQPHPRAAKPRQTFVSVRRTRLEAKAPLAPPARSGSHTLTAMPPPSRRASPSRPWCSSTISRDNASPSPLPVGLVVKNGSSAFCIISSEIPEPRSSTEMRHPPSGGVSTVTLISLLDPPAS